MSKHIICIIVIPVSSEIDQSPTLRQDSRPSNRVPAERDQGSGPNSVPCLESWDSLSDRSLLVFSGKNLANLGLMNVRWRFWGPRNPAPAHSGQLDHWTDAECCVVGTQWLSWEYTSWMFARAVPYLNPATHVDRQRRLWRLLASDETCWHQPATCSCQLKERRSPGIDCLPAACPDIYNTATYRETQTAAVYNSKWRTDLH